MNKPPNSDKRPSASTITLGLALLMGVVALLLIYVFLNNQDQGLGGEQQVDELAKAYPVGTSQVDAESGYPMEPPVSEGLTPPYPAPESRSQAPPPGEAILEEEILTAAPSLGIVLDENFTVLHVEPGSAAGEGGIVVGDALVSIGGVALTPEGID